MPGRWTTARAFAIAILCSGCTPTEDATGTSTQAFESADATLYDFELDGVLSTTSGDATTVRRRIETQLLYSVGPLNANRSVGHHAALSLDKIEVVAAAAGKFNVRYHARIPVAWGGAAPPPARYELILPASVETAEQARFTTTYAKTCTDPEGGITSAADAGRMFLFYRPARPGCALAASDVVRLTATTSKSTAQTTGKYPEYDRVWEDGALEVVAVFGVEVDDVPTDAGAKAYERFVLTTASDLGVAQSKPVARRVDIASALPDGRRVHVQATLVGKELAAEDASLDPWFDAATPRADLVFYSGHAGLGANVRSLMSKGSLAAGQYQIWFINGCDTLAYVDNTLAQRGNLDIVANALGSWFSTGDRSALAFVRALQGPPRTYRSILDETDPDQVSAVLGEEDNTFVPTTTVAATRGASGPPANDGVSITPSPITFPEPSGASERGCNATHRPDAGATWLVLLLLTILFIRRGRLGSGPASASASTGHGW